MPELMRRDILRQSGFFNRIFDYDLNRPCSEPYTSISDEKSVIFGL